MRFIKLMLIACALFLGGTVYSQEIRDLKFGKGMINYTAQDSSFSVKFAPRFQFRANTTWDFNDGELYNPEQNFLIRRARLKFDGWALSPKLKYKIELGLSNRDISGANEFTRNAPRYILDAVLMWNFYERFELWAGQTKLPGNVERVISSANLQFVDRSLLNANFNIDRDTGLQLRHSDKLSDDFLIREKLAFSQGEGRNVTEGNLGGFQYTARLELLPFGSFASDGEYVGADLKREQSPKLMLAATYDFNDNAVKTRSNLGSYMFLSNGDLYETDITTVFVDAVFKYRGLSFMGEFASRESDEPVAMIQGETEPDGPVVLDGEALNLQAGYLFNNNYEIAGRYTVNSFDEEAGRGDISEYTIGASKYIVGHKLKVQTDLSYQDYQSITDELRWRIGFEIHF